MTAPSSWINYRPKRTHKFNAPSLVPEYLSVVIPVRDNQIGVTRLIESLNRLSTPPNEIVIVDNLSAHPISPPASRSRMSVLVCSKAGPAAARNFGARVATGEWLWFLDSDCVVSEDSLVRFAAASGEVVGMCGLVKPQSNRLLGRYYDSQEILLPQFAENEEPLYLITASACIHRDTFLRLGGFDESFPLAAGEDIDFGFRLYQVGRLGFVRDAIVYHDFEEDITSFRRRFERYGIGNRLLANKYGICLAPSPFRPNHPTYLKRTLAKLQFEALTKGYGQHK